MYFLGITIAHTVTKLQITLADASQFTMWLCSSEPILAENTEVKYEYDMISK